MIKKQKAINMATLKRENLSDKLADIYGQKIIHNELRSGDMIMETQISKEWEVSRSPVRDALHLLEKAKLVVKDKRGSYKVLELTPEYIESFYDAFVMLYEYSFARATGRINKTHMKKLFSASKKIEKCVQKKDYDGYVENVTVIAYLILKAANNPIVEQIALDLMPTAHRINFAAIRLDPSHVEKVVNLVNGLPAAFENNDPQTAMEFFRQFADASRSVLIHHIEVEGGTV